MDENHTLCFPPSDSPLSNRERNQLEDVDENLLHSKGFFSLTEWRDTFVKLQDITERRYPLHYILNSTRICVLGEIQRLKEEFWYLKWDRLAYDCVRVQSRTHELKIPSGIDSPWERTCSDRWIVKTPRLSIQEAITFYDILNDARFSR